MSELVRDHKKVHTKYDKNCETCFVTVLAGAFQVEIEEIKCQQEREES